MQSSGLLLFVLVSLLVEPLVAVTLTQPSQLSTLTYDYVIVGAGNAGLVLANRLTEDPRVSVLVLEAGVSDQGVIPVEAPFLGPTATPNTAWDWNYTITPQVGMNGRSFPYPRGKILGGCSSVNYLFHQYGTDEDWNKLAAVSKDSGWSWANMRQYIRRHEKFTPPIDGHNTTGQYIPSLHSTSGILPISLPGNNQTIDPRVLATTKQLAEFPYNEDTAGGDHTLLGIGFLQSSAGGGVRSSSSTTYLAKANGRPNLTVLINATVLKLVQTGVTRSGAKSFRSVQFKSTPGPSTNPANLPAFIAQARNEVILSAGSVGTTQILQLSGIGKKEDLRAVNVNSVIDNPHVGYNLSDHTLLPNIFSVQGAQSFDHVLRDPNQVNAALNQWVVNKTGMFANNVVNNFGFARINTSLPVFATTPDPAPGPKSPHWEIITSNFWFNPGIAQPPTGSFMTIVAVLITPTSRGTIKLRSNNPFDAPLIDPRYLTTQVDVVIMREAVKAIQRFVAAPAWADYVIGPFGDAFAAASDDASIDAYVRGLMTTIFHPVSTAAIAPTRSADGVVNPDLTVKGADGLRIVDMSVFPFIPSSHPQGALYLLAERAADIIKAQN